MSRYTSRIVMAILIILLSTFAPMLTGKLAESAPSSVKITENMSENEVQFAEDINEINASLQSSLDDMIIFSCKIIRFIGIFMLCTGTIGFTTSYITGDIDISYNTKSDKKEKIEDDLKVDTTKELDLTKRVADYDIEYKNYEKALAQIKEQFASFDCIITNYKNTLSNTFGDNSITTSHFVLSLEKSIKEYNSNIDSIKKLLYYLHDKDLKPTKEMAAEYKSRIEKLKAANIEIENSVRDLYSQLILKMNEVENESIEENKEKEKEFQRYQI